MSGEKSGIQAFSLGSCVLRRLRIGRGRRRRRGMCGGGDRYCSRGGQAALAFLVPPHEGLRKRLGPLACRPIIGRRGEFGGEDTPC